jgi:AcrR family transcriptional regulator
MSSAAKPRRSGDRHRTPSVEVERALVDAAYALLEADGPDGLSVRAIAAAAGVAPMGVYNHLGNKNGVVDALFIRGFDALRDAFAEVDGDPLGSLRESCRRYRALALAQPRTYGVMFDQAVAGFTPSPAAWEHACAAFDRLVDMVGGALAAGAIREDDPVEVAQRLWSTMHGAVSLELRHMGFVEDLDGYYERLVDSTLRGLV